MTQTLILAFDTSGPHCATALVRGDRVLATRFQEMSKGQAERLMPQIAATLADDGVALDILDAIAVGIGPGNFTGIRIAVAAARGLALSLGIPAIGVSNFEVMRGRNTFRAQARQIVSLPAARGGFYLQAFEDGRASGPPHMVESLHGPLPPAIEMTSTTEILGHLAGDLSFFHRGVDGATGALCSDRVLPGERAAQIIGQIAADKLQQDRGHPRPAPLYIRAADAAPSREQGPQIL